MDQMVSANLVFFIQKPCCPGCLPVHFQISYSLALSLFALPLPPLNPLARLSCLLISKGLLCPRASRGSRAPFLCPGGSQAQLGFVHLGSVSPSQVQCLESLLAPMTSAGKKKINPLQSFFKALGEVRSPSYRSPGQRLSTLQIFSLPWKAAVTGQGRAAAGARKGK